MMPQIIEEEFAKKFCVMIERSGYSDNEIEEIYNFLSGVYKKGYEAGLVRKFHHKIKINLK